MIPSFRRRLPNTGAGSGRPLPLLLAAMVLLLLVVALLTLSHPVRWATHVWAMKGGTAAQIPFLDSDLLQRADSLTNQADEPQPGVILASNGVTRTTYLPLAVRSVLTLEEYLTLTTLSLPQPLADTTSSWCTWGGCLLGPRLYHAPLPDGRTLLGWTDSNGTGHVSVIAGASIEHTYNYAAKSLRGLVTHDDGGFAILLWQPSTETMWLSKRATNGSEVWTSSLNSDIARADFWLGGSRLSYGDGLYAAYFTVYGISGPYATHHGDQLTYVNDGGVKQSGGWDWGCSHSMAQLVSYHPDLAEFLPVCSSDCYPQKGIIAMFSTGYNRVYAADGNCGGLVSAQLGQIALGDGDWKVVFNALSEPCCTGRGIAFATVDAGFDGAYTWLTNTNGSYERDPVLGRLGTELQSDRYLVGWTTTNNGAYWLAIIDGEGTFIRAPENLAPAGVRWGNRDDSFRTRPDGTVSWVYGEPLSTELTLFQFDGTAYLP
jgi:hypothetical protein